MNLQETIKRILREELFDKKQNSQSDILTNFKNQDQEERNEYQKFVHSEFNGDYERAAKEYAKLKNRSFDDIFGDKERMEKFISIDFDFDGFSDEDWENYWLLSQHADTNPNFQKDALKTISQYLGKDNDNYKYLHDRISCRETGTQKYGTQNICKKYSLGINESILREESSAQTKLKGMVSNMGVHKSAKMFGGVSNLYNVLGITNTREDMIFIVKTLMENDVPIIENVCDFKIVPTQHSLKLYVEIPKYYSNLADDSWANRQRVLRARDNISTIINRLGNSLVRGYTVDVSLGKC